MDKLVGLVPLKCVNCQTPVPAEPDERAWVCTNCGQGLLLDEGSGLLPLEVQYAANIRPDSKGRPFWVAEGRVELSRETFDRSGEMEAAQQYWGEARRFFVPAYTCPMNKLLNLGGYYLASPPQLEVGKAVSFEPVTLSLKDVQTLAEFIVLAVEAKRKDKLKRVEINLKLDQPSLWILPSEGD